MASIKGIEIKGVKGYQGHEGYCQQGNIYMDGKKIGFYSEDGWGGPPTLDVNSKELKQELKQRMSLYYQEHPQIDSIKMWKMEKEEIILDSEGKMDESKLPRTDFTNGGLFESNLEELFFPQLLELKDMESAYKKAIKKGFKEIVSLHYLSIRNSPRPLDMYYSTNGSEEVYQEIISLIENPYVIIKRYKSLDDFKIE